MYLQNRQDGKIKVLWLLRDSQQSTLPDSEWAVSGTKLIKLIEQGIATGFPAVEIGGGRFWEISLLSGQNPFRLMNKANDVIKSMCANSASPVEMQVLVRGANGMGFNPVDPSVQLELIEQHARVGIHTFRTFDALNDINKLRYFKTQNPVHLQGCLAYTMDSAETHHSDAIYTIDYYVNYAQRLLQKGFQSLCIKDMAGQLRYQEAKPLIERLKAECNCPVTLHIHSTDYSRSLRTIYTAIDAGIDGIEVSVAPLHDGAGHHNVRTFLDVPQVQELDIQQLDALEKCIEQTCDASTRVDVKIPDKIRKRLCSAGVPGGAIPSVVSMLQAQFKKEMSEDNTVDQGIFLDRYIEYVTRVRRDAGNVPLVTPSADIVCRQAVFCLSSNRQVEVAANDLTLEEMYSSVTPDFARLVLGHYGVVYCYGQVDAIVGQHHIPISYPNSSLIDVLSTRAITGDSPLENLWESGSDGVMRVQEEVGQKYPQFSDFLAEVDAFIFRLADVLATKLRRNVAQHIAENMVYRFASRDQLALFLALPPKGKDSLYLWNNLVLKNFLHNSAEGVLLQEGEALELMEALYGLQCLPDAWKSKSSDAYTLAGYMPKITDHFQNQVLKIERAIQDEEEQISHVRQKCWMYRPPTSRSKVQALIRKKEALEQQIAFCGTINADSVLADNEPARLMLNQFIYPAIAPYVVAIENYSAPT